MPLIENACVEFLEILAENAESGRPFNIMSNFEYFTCDTIARVAFGQNKPMVSSGQNSTCSKSRKFTATTRHKSISRLCKSFLPRQAAFRRQHRPFVAKSVARSADDDQAAIIGGEKLV